MKLKIKPYLARLIKENIVYIISIFLLLILTIINTKLGFDRLFQSKSKIEKLNEDIVQLEKKVKLYQTSIPSTEKLDEDIKLLNNLIPGMEDYFSVIYALEKLSQKTGFVIVDYIVNVQKSTHNKLRLTVNGIGDSSTFLKFLSEYKFGGGRLITSDKIELNPEISGSIKLNLTFYNKSVSQNEKEVVATDEKMFQELENIKNKVSFDFTEKEDPSDMTYPTKKNPF